ncbi:TPA: DoxX family protein [Acinetobacter baumannii]|jgi:putative oxidoreductase|nr:DoxX family protein [Acinetobacter baumannii]
MNTSSATPYAALLLRLTLAGYFFAHAGLKLFVYTPSGTAQFFQSIGVPGWMAYVTIIWEVVGATALLLGFKARIIALALIPVLIGSIATVHGAAGFFFTNPNGGWEFPMMWIISLISLALIGDGPLALSKSFKSTDY